MVVNSVMVADKWLSATERRVYRDFSWLRTIHPASLARVDEITKPRGNCTPEKWNEPTILRQLYPMMPSGHVFSCLSSTFTGILQSFTFLDRTIYHYSQHRAVGIAFRSNNRSSKLP